METGAVKRRAVGTSNNGVLLGAAGNLASVVAALGVADGAGRLLAPPVVWLLASRLAAVTHVPVQGGELAFAERLKAQVRNDQEAQAPRSTGVWLVLATSSRNHLFV